MLLPIDDRACHHCRALVVPILNRFKTFPDLIEIVASAELRHPDYFFQVTLARVHHGNRGKDRPLWRYRDGVIEPEVLGERLVVVALRRVVTGSRGGCLGETAVLPPGQLLPRGYLLVTIGREVRLLLVFEHQGLLLGRVKDEVGSVGVEKLRSENSAAVCRVSLPRHLIEVFGLHHGQVEIFIGAVEAFFFHHCAGFPRRHHSVSPVDVS